MPGESQGPDLDRVTRTMDRVAELRTRAAVGTNEALRAALAGELVAAVRAARDVDGDVGELEAVCASTERWAADLAAGLRANHLAEARADARRLWDAVDGALLASEGAGR